jgi:hypothetical protein
MQRLKAVLGYAGAVLTVVAMMVMPFVLFPVFQGGVAATGVEVDPVYTGGAIARVVAKDGYRILVNQPVRSRALLARPAPFVQLAWEPARSLPARITDEVDVDGDGRADLTACFEVPADTTVELVVDVAPEGGLVSPLHRVSRESFSALIARVGDRIVVRVPLATR